MADAKLIAIVEANTKQFENALKRLEALGRTSMQSQERSAVRLEQSFNRLGTSVGRFGSIIKSNVLGSLAALTAGLSVEKVAQYADAWTRLNNQLAAASQISGKQARSASEVNKIANATRSSLDETGKLYSRLLRATAGLAVSEAQVAAVTKTVNQAFKAGGSEMSEQIAGILQLSQALSSGFLQGDELRSIRETAPLIAQAIADEFNTTIGGLKALGASGEITSARIIHALEAGAPKIEAAFKATSSTMAEGVTLVGNAFEQFVGFMNDSTNASHAFIDGLNGIASALDSLPGAVKAFRSELDKLNESPFWDKFIVTQSEAAGFKKQLDEMEAAAAKANQGPTTTEGAIAKLSEDFQNRVKVMLDTGLVNPAQQSVIKDIIELLGKKTPEATKKAIDNIHELANGLFSLEVPQGLDTNFLHLAQVLQGDIDKVKELTLESLKLAASKIPASEHFAGPDNASDLAKTASIERIRQQEALVTRLIAEGGKSEQQKKDAEDLAKKINDIQKAAKDAHTELSEGATELLAKTLLAADKIASAFDVMGKSITASSTDAAELLRRLENPNGPWTTPHFDTNRLRIGFSSDTQTNEMGRVTDVTAASTSTVADAERDLARRISLIQMDLIKVIGEDVFKQLNSGAIAAITSVGYNYGTGGSAFKGVANAAKGGSAVDVSNAILALPQNPVRRRVEAETALTGAPGGEAALKALQGQNAATEDATKKTKALADAKAELIASTERSIESLNLEAKTFGESTFEKERAKEFQDLYNQSVEKGIELTPDYVAKLHQLADAHANASVAVEAAKTAQDNLETANQNTIERMDELRSFSSGVLSGFISDMVHGKSAAEALQAALGKIADKLLDIASDSIIGALFGGQGTSAGGLLGSFLGIGGASSGASSVALTDPLFGLAKGGVMTSKGPVPLRRYASGGIATSPQMAMFGEGSQPEAYVPLPDGRRIPVNMQAPRLSGGAGMGQQRVAVDNTIHLAPSEMFDARVESRVRSAQAETFRRMPGYLGDQRARQAGSAR